MVSLRANQFMFIIHKMEILLMVVHCLLFMRGSRKFCQGMMRGVRIRIPL